MIAPCQFVIFGATGDLSVNKLLPALYHLFLAGRLGRADVQPAVHQRRIHAHYFAAETLRPFHRQGGLARRGGAHQGDGEGALVAGHVRILARPSFPTYSRLLAQRESRYCFNAVISSSVSDDEKR